MYLSKSTLDASCAQIPTTTLPRENGLVESVVRLVRPCAERFRVRQLKKCRQWPTDSPLRPDHAPTPRLTVSRAKVKCQSQQTRVRKLTRLTFPQKCLRTPISRPSGKTPAGSPLEALSSLIFCWPFRNSFYWLSETYKHGFQQP